ncbi:cyclic peptide export ABC transporter [Psychromarinibacter sp. C21-152]|uniref:Cyclic peptide export ABC transporter n=1 Tax=Psychromarinibacter sediminicola TaxID=3033385 RepID=A0AAE3T7S9_9RHOB|nr:cyclic peptide export ABC transporter [Psychromarinibacter sediminicola]MDF0600038.1 cyclic peptide export ABC transporter [Psychromarinibacter sediminicola]
MRTSAFGKLRDLVGFLVRDGEMLRSPILLYAVGASGARTGMIYAVNETAERGGATWGLFGLLAAAVVGSLVLSHQARVHGIVMVENLTLKLRRRISDHVLSADVGFFQSRDPGEVYSALTGHVMALSGASTRLVETVQAVLLLLFCLVYMALESWPAVPATLAALALGLAAFALAELPARKLLRLANDKRAEFYTAMNDMLRGYKELRLRQARRIDLAKRVEQVVEEARLRTIAAERIFSFSTMAATAALAFLLVSIVVLLPPLTGAGSVVILQVLTVVLFTFGPIERVVGSLPAYARAIVAYDQMNEVLADMARNSESEAVRRAPDSRPSFRRLELRGVTAILRRPTPAAGSTVEDSFTLGPIDLVLEPGQSVFITGGNGMGKSTLLQILTGLRHPDAGEILVDGVPVTRDTVGEYRGLFSAVFSEFHLFRQLYGLSADERQRLQTHIEELGLAHGVSIADDAFSSLALSTGQMRRLALSIALAEERPIIVLDEFAADQDPVRRAFFYDVLVPRLSRAGQLLIAVTHDEHCFGKSDRLIRMEDGRIVSDKLNRPAEASA